MNLIVNPIFLRRDRKGEEGELHRSNPIDTKVRGLVLSRIGMAKYGLLPSSFVPQMALDLAMEVGEEKRERFSRERKEKKMRMIPVSKKVPIGLWAVEPQGWLNALMQFIFFIPRFVEHFYFAPKSFAVFRDYIDAYRDDQEEQKAVSSVNGSLLLRFFSLRLQFLTLKEIFRFLIQVFGAKWETIERLDEKKGSGDEFFLSDSPDGKLFVWEGHVCYELDAFIEARPDEGVSHYITYGKVGGVWYQCDDDRILMVRSNFLNIPLSRATLLHYKKIVV